MSRSLIVLPQDTAQPLLDALAAAQRSIRIKMFIFTDRALIEAVAAARTRGVDVRVMLNPARRSGEEENEAARTALLAAGVTVADSHPAFEITHEKSMVVDDEVAYVMSLNWESVNFSHARDYAVVTRHRHEVEEVAACFDADWNRQTFDPGENTHLIWCNLNGRNRIARFIDSAKQTLFLENERYQDEVIIERLTHAAHRGVKLHVLARPVHTLKHSKLVEGVEGLRILHDVGGRVHKLRHLKLHAKMMLADGKRAIVGSINFAPGSFDHRRELAIEVHDPHVIERLAQTAREDWENSHKLDLSDEGLLRDLTDDAARELALRTDRRD
jgi:phosphatidylserine/phosphatidylglycerophosphate/cardiolipin synthase-like enzyme